MSNYAQITFFAPKDALLSGNPAKLIKGADVDPELAAISTAIASKYDGTNFAFANPSGTIGLTANNGTSNNPMRSDATPALSQAISPTWTGAHTFNALTTFRATASAVSWSGANASLGIGTAFSAGQSELYTSSTNPLGIGTTGAAALNFYTNSLIRAAITSAGNVTIAAPTSGTALTVSGLSGAVALQISSGGGGVQPLVVSGNATQTIAQFDSTNATGGAIFFSRNSTAIGHIGNANYLDGGTLDDFVVRSTNGLGFDTNNGSRRMTIATAGNVTINAPTGGGTTLAAAGSANGSAISVTGSATSGQSFGVTINGGTTSADYGLTITNQAGSSTYFRVRGDGVVQANDGAVTLFELGYKDIPPNAQTVNYTTVMSDRGKGIDMNGANLTATIAANASVAYPVGTVLVFTNLNATNLLVAINTDTLTMAGTTTTGTRTVAQNGVLSARKVTATSWICSGPGVS